jgi:transcriptional regulator with XRE-family HTH domain
LSSRKGLIERLNKSEEARERFVSSHVDKGCAYQIREMREQRGLSQTELGEMAGMNQNAIHRLESPDYGKATISTLKRVAAAFDVALIVRFVPFSQLVDWVSGRPYIDYGLSSDSLAVPSFKDDSFAHETNLQSTSGIELMNFPWDTAAYQHSAPAPLVKIEPHLLDIPWNLSGAGASTNLLPTYISATSLPMATAGIRYEIKLPAFEPQGAHPLV